MDEAAPASCGSPGSAPPDPRSGAPGAAGTGPAARSGGGRASAPRAGAARPPLRALLRAGRARPGVEAALELAPLRRRARAVEAAAARADGPFGRAWERRRLGDPEATLLPLEALAARRAAAHRAAEGEWRVLAARAAAIARPVVEARQAARAATRARHAARVQARHALAGLRQRARMDVEAERTSALRELERARLARVEVASASIPGLGEAAREALLAAGVRSAADLREAFLMEVPGLEPAQALVALRWRWRLARPMSEHEERAERRALEEAAGRAAARAAVHEARLRREARIRDARLAAAERAAAAAHGEARARAAAELAKLRSPLERAWRAEARTRAELAAVEEELARLLRALEALGAAA